MSPTSYQLLYPAVFNLKRNAPARIVKFDALPVGPRGIQSRLRSMIDQVVLNSIQNRPA